MIMHIHAADTSDELRHAVLMHVPLSNNAAVTNNTSSTKKSFYTGSRSIGTRPRVQLSAHDRERLHVEATIVQSSFDDIRHYFDNTLQSNFFSERELLTWYALYNVPVFCAYIATLPGYEPHIRKMHDQLHADRKIAKKITKLMGLKLDAARKLIDPMYTAVCHVHAQRKYEQQYQEAQRMKALHQQTMQHNQQQVMVLEQDALEALIEDWKVTIDDALDALVGRYKKRLSAASFNVWQENAYTLSSPMYAVLTDQQLNPDTYTTFYGNALQQVLHGEFVDIIEQAVPIHTHYAHISSVHGLTTFAVQMADIGAAYNKEGAIVHASHIADVCWVTLDCIAAAVEGIEEGLINTADMVIHPVDTLYSFGRAAKTLGNCIAFIIVEIGEAELYRAAGVQYPPDKWHEKIVRMQQMYDRLYAAAAQLKARDCVKGVTLFATECFLQARLLKVVGTLAGESAKTLLNCAEKVADLVPNPKLVLSLPEAMHVEVVEQILNAVVHEERLFNLVKKAENIYMSVAGLIYECDPNFGNRLYHVLEHTKEVVGKIKHTVFNVTGEELFSLIDEAWLKRGMSLANDMRVYVVDLNRVIGTRGETAIRIVVKQGTSRIVTAYPVKV